MARETTPREAWLGSLNAPAERGGAAGVTRFLHDVYLSRPDLQRAYPDLDGDDGPLLVEWAQRSGWREALFPEELLPAGSDCSHPRLVVSGLSENWWGVNVAGYLRGALGLGEAARLTVRALDAAGIPALPVELSHLPDIGHWQPYGTVRTLSPPFPITITCANPDHLWEWAEQAGGRFFEERHNIGFWWWEALDCPRTEWLVPSRLLDEVWVGSRHVAEAIAPLTSAPVSILRLPVEVAPVGRVDRRALGLPEGFLFLFAFDFNSTVARKNPLGLIEAFRSAFAPGAGASLVIKSFNGNRHPAARAQLERAAAEHPDVTLLDGYVAPAIKDALLAACDCYVSLHRSEGFGLALAEAMYLGKPVVATGFGGNLDFMSERNAYLVGWRATRVGADAAPYPAHGTWAEPDSEHAARLLRAVFDDPGAAAERGARGAADIRELHSPEAAARSVRSLLAPARAATERRLLHARRAAPAAPVLAEARELVEAGPEALGSRGPRSWLRRVVLRLLRPLSAWQRWVDETLLAALEEALEARSATERRLLDLQDGRWEEAQRRAEALARLRRGEHGTQAEPSLAVLEESA